VKSNALPSFPMQCKVVICTALQDSQLMFYLNQTIKKLISSSSPFSPGERLSECAGTHSVLGFHANFWQLSSLLLEMCCTITHNTQITATLCWHQWQITTNTTS